MDCFFRTQNILNFVQYIFFTNMYGGAPLGLTPLLYGDSWIRPCIATKLVCDGGYGINGSIVNR